MAEQWGASQNGARRSSWVPQSCSQLQPHAKPEQLKGLLVDGGFFPEIKPAMEHRDVFPCFCRSGARQRILCLVTCSMRHQEHCRGGTGSEAWPRGGWVLHCAAAWRDPKSSWGSSASPGAGLSSVDLRHGALSRHLLFLSLLVFAHTFTCLTY